MSEYLLVSCIYIKWLFNITQRHTLQLLFILEKQTKEINLLSRNFLIFQVNLDV